MALYKLYARAMFNTSLRILGQNGEAEEAMQEAFLKAFAKLDEFGGQVEFGAWLKRIVVNQSLDVLRARKSRVGFLEELDGQEMASDDEQDPPWDDEQEMVGRLKAALPLLPEGYRAVLSLYLFEGYDHQEIAQILGVEASASRSQLSRAKKKLAELLSKNPKKST